MELLLACLLLVGTFANAFLEYVVLPIALLLAVVWFINLKGE